MSREELRPCDVNIVDIVKAAYGDTKVEHHKAYFHRWFERKIGEWHELLAVVEYEDGKIHFVNANDITFTDRQNVTVNIDADSIAKVAICKD